AVDGVISVQARQSLVETDWLLELAQDNDFIQGVVGWIPLADPTVHDQLGSFAKHAKLKAVRHVVQGEPDDNFILGEEFNQGVAALREFGLAYDILIFERHLPQTIAFVDRHPDQVFVLDHLGKPRIGENMLEPWRTNLFELARRSNVYCKVSGMVTEADYASWTPQQLLPFWNAALEAFGPSRLMFGSDWPVCLVACEYGRWWDIIAGFASQLSSPEQEQVFGKTATEAYGLKSSTSV
ncbi:MAG: amidohydrolase family protein, partial [Aeoliella sp.]